MLQSTAIQPIAVYEPTIENIINMVVDGLDSPNSKRTYRMALRGFLEWYVNKGRPQLTAAVVKAYKAELQESGLKAASVNIRLVTVRRLCVEAVDNGLVDEKYLAGIQRVKGMRAFVTRSGNWLSKEDAERLLGAPVMNTMKGIRDRAMLALLVGCGLRRTELVNLEFKHIQKRDNRWVILDMIGKGNKMRTVPVPRWAKTAVDEWVKTSGLKAGAIFRELSRVDNHIPLSERKAISPQGLRDVVNHYGKLLNLDIAPHDLRRTFAKLAHKGGAGLEQIQLTLGHSSLVTTERYLGIRQNLEDAPCDHLGLEIKS